MENIHFYPFFFLFQEMTVTVGSVNTDDSHCEMQAQQSVVSLSRCLFHKSSSLKEQEKKKRKTFYE